MTDLSDVTKLNAIFKNCHNFNFEGKSYLNFPGLTRLCTCHQIMKIYKSKEQKSTSRSGRSARSDKNMKNMYREKLVWRFRKFPPVVVALFLNCSALQIIVTGSNHKHSCSNCLNNSQVAIFNICIWKLLLENGKDNRNVCSHPWWCAYFFKETLIFGFGHSVFLISSNFYVLVYWD